MNHADVRNQMADYLEGDLSLGPRALFDAHLDECPDCAAEVAQLRRTIGALRNLPDPEPPPMFVQDVMRRVRLGEARPTFWDHARSFTDFVLSPKILAPISAAAIAAGIVIGTEPLRVLMDQPGGLTAQVSQTPMPIQVAGLANPFVRPDETVRQQGLSPGAKMVARSEMIEASTAPTRFSDWTSVESFPSSRVTAPTISIAIRSGNMGSRDLARGGWRPSAYLPAQPPLAAEALPTADDWLGVVEREPDEFAMEMATRSLAEREHWIESLSRRAVEQGRLDSVVSALRNSPDPLTRALADEMSASGLGYGGGTLSASNAPID